MLQVNYCPRLYGIQTAEANTWDTTGPETHDTNLGVAGRTHGRTGLGLATIQPHLRDLTSPW